MIGAEAKRRVLAALEEIEKFDTDRAFILAARRRYCDLTQPHLAVVEPKRCDAGAGIVMTHSNIRTGY
ncbi:MULTISPECIES: hypothetical protein [Mesorhizobium]|uniref:hypothetical protein n=1 Tax=Mesorhizobium TaxID=68287 RepID=UPI0007A93CE0|nr:MULTISPECIES: hypothetical protein [Mesorhizobium]AMX93734.1 hypothetical protein A4R28_11780 [Mesorhizobium ciceri]MDF3208435.1 hypothetical protein [Mesorhizobium sp. LMG15046]MDF3228994.1 hypothetical protein [Mesorhizobium sp. DSM 30133]RUU22112.1 hypothetical protein EOC84_03105 [Mesorhizobium sp. Primo-B]RUU37978.1 hypothetical protein EOC83_17110 [Mesorhizobium sp. Primo-A]